MYTPGQESIGEESSRDRRGPDYFYDEGEEQDEEDEYDQEENDDAYEAIRALKLQSIGKGPQYTNIRADSGLGQLDISLPQIKGNQ